MNGDHRRKFVAVQAHIEAKADGVGAGLDEGLAPLERVPVHAGQANSDPLPRLRTLDPLVVHFHGANPNVEPAWLRALRLRSEALNQRYKLGEHSPRS